MRSLKKFQENELEVMRDKSTMPWTMKAHQKDKSTEYTETTSLCFKRKLKSF